MFDPRVICALLYITLCLPGAVMADGLSANPHNGRVNVSGVVVSSSCTIALEDAWQTVNMGVLPIRDITARKAEPQKEIAIHLRNCSLLEEKKSTFQSLVTVVFEGTHLTEPHLFDLLGDAKGVALEIHDGQGYRARSGESLPAIPVYGSEQELRFRLALVPNGDPIIAGTYYAAIRFKLNYE